KGRNFETHQRKEAGEDRQSFENIMEVEESCETGSDVLGLQAVAQIRRHDEGQRRRRAQNEGQDGSPLLLSQTLQAEGKNSQRRQVNPRKVKLHDAKKRKAHCHISPGLRYEFQSEVRHRLQEANEEDHSGEERESRIDDGAAEIQAPRRDAYPHEEPCKRESREPPMDVCAEESDTDNRKDVQKNEGRLRYCEKAKR